LDREIVDYQRAEVLCLAMIVCQRNFTENFILIASRPEWSHLPVATRCVMRGTAFDGTPGQHAQHSANSDDARLWIADLAS